MAKGRNINALMKFSKKLEGKGRLINDSESNGEQEKKVQLHT